MSESTLDNVQSILRQAHRRRPRFLVTLIIASLSVILAMSVYAYIHIKSAPLSGAQIIAVTGMVKQASETQAVSGEQIWQRVHDRFGTRSMLDLSSGDFVQVVEFLAPMIAEPTRSPQSANARP